MQFAPFCIYTGKSLVPLQHHLSENNVTYVKKPIIIVKPLVTEAQTEKINDINVPTIEKLLVDIKKDQDFAYLQGSEAQRMWEIGESLYNINPG